MITKIDLFNNLKGYSMNDIKKIEKAYRIASELHKDQKRKSGEPYIIHPINVAYILTKFKADSDTICAGLLHDTLEDTNITKEQIAYEFNDSIAELVDGVTKMRRLNFETKLDQNLANNRKIITGLMKDVRIIIIKLADRLHNMRTLEFMKPEKQKEISLETMTLFVPLANLVGIYWVKCELEDLALLYLNKDKYNECAEIRHMQEVGFNFLLDEMKYQIGKRLNAEGIENEIDKKIKNIYGIYKRMKDGKKLSEIHDLLSLKVVVNNIPNCYLTLGLVHEMYHPLDNRFKDYICKEKENKYRSLHTTVFGKYEKTSEDNRLVQTRIRTKEMNDIALYGLTANWNLNSEEARIEMKKFFEKYHEYKSIKDIDEKACGKDNLFIEEVNNKVFTDKIYVYSPKGDMVALPVGSTPLDYAYFALNSIRDNIKKVIVNDIEVPIDYRLNQHDIVRIITNDLVNQELEVPKKKIYKNNIINH